MNHTLLLTDIPEGWHVGMELTIHADDGRVFHHRVVGIELPSGRLRLEPKPSRFMWANWLVVGLCIALGGGLWILALLYW